MAALTPTSPWLQPTALRRLTSVYNFDGTSVSLLLKCLTKLNHKCIGITYPALCLLVATSYQATRNKDETFTFAMLDTAFRESYRTSIVAPAQLGGQSIGIIDCSTDVLLFVSYHC